MADLSHWDFAEDFDVWDAAALILGIEPAESERDEDRVRVVWRRMESDFRRALYQCLSDYYDGPPWPAHGARLYSTSVRRLENWGRLIAARDREPDESPELPAWWASDPEARQFGNQRFTRASLATWLNEAGQRSVYPFVPEQLAEVEAADQSVDPSDLPLELQAANIAFRAVLNGYGDSNATFKTRLVDYLRGHFDDLTPEAVSRIATVANPNKEPGRRKRQPE